MLLGDEQSAKERRDFGRAKELQAERLAKDVDIRSKLKSFEDTESVYEERGKKIQGLEEAIRAIKANQTRLSDNGEYDEAEALQGELEGLLAEHAKMMTRWTDVTETMAPNITMQIEVKTIRRMPVAPGSSTMIDVQLINTPGYGSIIHSLEDSYSMIDREIETRIGLHASMSGRKKLHESMLVHTCIFFIAPHRLAEADLQMMAKLQDRCPLIPVIAKADTMTIEEATMFKDTVRRELKVRNISTAAVDFNVLHDISERNGVEHRLPFAIVSARAPDSSGLAQRCYDWGCANTDNPRHSELSVLRELLLGEWQSLRNQAIDKIDTELQIRSGDPWKEQERKKKAEEEMAQRLEFERRACPNKLVETKALLEETSEALKQKKATLDETKAALRETKATLATTEVTLQQKKTTLDETKAALRETKATLATTKGTLQQKETTLDEMKATLQQKETTLDEMKATLQQKKTTLDETKAALRETKATLATTKGTLQQKETTLDEMKATLQQKETTLDEMKATLQQKKTTLDETKAALRETKATLATTKGTLQQKETTLDEMKATLQQKETTLDEMKATLQQKKATLDETKAALRATKATLATTEVTLQQKETTLDETKAALRATKATLATTEVTLQQKEATLDETKAAIRETKATLATTKGALQQKETTLDETKAARRETKATLATTKRTLQQKETMLDETKAALRETKATLATTKGTLQQKETMLDETKAALRETKAKIAEYCASLRFTTASICP